MGLPVGGLPRAARSRAGAERAGVRPRRAAQGWLLRPAPPRRARRAPHRGDPGVGSRNAAARVVRRVPPGTAPPSAPRQVLPETARAGAQGAGRLPEPRPSALAVGGRETVLAGHRARRCEHLRGVPHHTAGEIRGLPAGAGALARGRAAGRGDRPHARGAPSDRGPGGVDRDPPGAATRASPGGLERGARRRLSRGVRRRRGHLADRLDPGRARPLTRGGRGGAYAAGRVRRTVRLEVEHAVPLALPSRRGRGRRRAIPARGADRSAVHLPGGFRGRPRADGVRRGLHRRAGLPRRETGRSHQRAPGGRAGAAARGGRQRRRAGRRRCGPRLARRAPQHRDRTAPPSASRDDRAAARVQAAAPDPRP